MEKTNTHKWLWYPGLSECKRCGLLWFPTISHKDTAAFLTEVCPRA